MLLPSSPMTPFIVRQTGFALAPLETFFHTMFRLGHPRQLPQRGLRLGIGQIIVDFADLLLVAVPGAYHHQYLLLALLTPMVPGDHPPRDDLDDQRPFGPIADIKALPGGGVQRLTPGLHAVPGTRGPASFPTLFWERRLQIPDRRVRGDGQQIPCVQGR